MPSRPAAPGVVSAPAPALDTYTPSARSNGAGARDASPSPAPALGRASASQLRAGSSEPRADALRVESRTTDSSFRIRSGEDGRVEIEAGIGGRLEAQGGEVGLRIGGESYTVPTEAGESVSKALDTLAGKIARSRLGLEVEWLPTMDTIREQWTIRPKASNTAPSSGAPVGRALPITSRTTDGLFGFFPDENGSVEIQAGIGGPLEAEGGEVGLEIAGRDYSVHTRGGEDASKVLNELAGKIVRSRLTLEVEYLFTIDTLHEQWTIGSKTEAPAV